MRHYATFAVKRYAKGSPEYKAILPELLDYSGDPSQLTVLVVNELDPVTLSAGQLLLIWGQFSRLMAKDKCLSEEGYREVAYDRFMSRDLILSGYQRVHWFGHYAISFLNETRSFLSPRVLLDCEDVQERIFKDQDGQILVVFTNEVHPHAFIKVINELWDHFNMLIEGQILRLPTLEEMGFVGPPSGQHHKVSQLLTLAALT